MSLATDIQADYQFIDGVEDVTITPDTPATSAVTGVKALQRQLSRSDVFFGSAAGISPSDTVFHVWASTMGALTTLNPEDKITQASGVIWRIISLQYSPITGRWRCICRKQR
jgi:hypothetical protein